MRGFREFRKAVRDEIDGKADDIRAQAAARVRSDPRILESWMGYCGADCVAGIDYANPCVEIEWWAADPSLHMLAAMDGEAFLERTGCDRETFMRYYDQSAFMP